MTWIYVFAKFGFISLLEYKKEFSTVHYFGSFPIWWVERLEREIRKIILPVKSQWNLLPLQAERQEEIPELVSQLFSAKDLGAWNDAKIGAQFLIVRK